jgi:hypothetical protein
MSLKFSVSQIALGAGKLCSNIASFRSSSGGFRLLRNQYQVELVCRDMLRLRYAY